MFFFSFTLLSMFVVIPLVENRKNENSSLSAVSTTPTLKSNRNKHVSASGQSAVNTFIKEETKINQFFAVLGFGESFFSKMKTEKLNHD